MSMILDALKRADRERRRQETELPSLNSEHRPLETAPTNAPPHRSWRKTAMVAIALLALGAAIGLALASLRTTDGGVTQRQVAEAGGENVSADAGRDTPARAELPKEPAEQPPEPALAAESRPDRAAPETNSRDNNASPTEIARLYQSEQSPAQAPPSDVRRLYQQPNSLEQLNNPEPQTREEPRRASPTVSTEPARVSLPEPRETAAVRLNSQQREPTVTPSTPEADANPTPTPSSSDTLSIRELPWAMQQKIPSISYQGHHYRGGNNSSVTLNRKEHRAGAQVAPDIRVEEIEEDGVVLSYRGEKFKLKALNSWVNM